jgi:hypothetical protein
MDVELLTDGTAINTRLIVDGQPEQYIKEIEIYVGDKLKAQIKANGFVYGTIPYTSMTTIRGIRYQSIKDGRILSTATEPFEYRFVMIRRA